MYNRGGASDDFIILCGVRWVRIRDIHKNVGRLKLSEAHDKKKTNNNIIVYSRYRPMEEEHH